MIDVTPYREIILTLGVSVVRILTVFTAIPFMSAQMIPGLGRTAFAISMALVLFPMVSVELPAQAPGTLELIALIGKEVVIGLLFGYVVSIPFRVAEGLGFFIDNQRGTGMASVFNPMSGSESSPLGVLMVQVAIMIFVSTGGLLMMLKGLFATYETSCERL